MAEGNYAPRLERHHKPQTKKERTMKNSVASFDNPSSDSQGRPEPGQLWCFETPEEWANLRPVKTRKPGETPTLTELEDIDNAIRRTPTKRQELSEDRREPNRTDTAYLALWKTWQPEEKEILSTLVWQDQEDIRQTLAMNCWLHAYHAEALQLRTSRINWIREEIQRHRAKIAPTIGTASGSAEGAAELRRLSLESKIEAQERNHLAEAFAMNQPKRVATRLM
jgi:hypothetical protein